MSSFILLLAPPWLSFSLMQNCWREMSPLAVPLAHCSFSLNSTICFLLPHLNCHCSCKSQRPPLGRSRLSCEPSVLFLSPKVSLWPSSSFSVSLGALFSFFLSLKCGHSWSGVPGSLLFTLSPGGHPHQKVSSLPRVSRFPDPAQISLLKEANTDCSFRHGCRPRCQASHVYLWELILFPPYPPPPVLPFLQVAPSSFLSSQADNASVTFTEDCSYFFTKNWCLQSMVSPNCVSKGPFSSIFRSISPDLYPLTNCPLQLIPPIVF